MKSLFVATLAVISFGASAVPSSVCGNGQHTGNPHCTSGGNTSTSNPSSGVVNNGGNGGLGGSGGHGGHGGHGGQGGAGVGVGVGIGVSNANATGGQGGSVLGSGNSNNTNNLGQQQGQLQGQQQGQNQVATGGNAAQSSVNNNSSNASNSNVNSAQGNTTSVNVQGGSVTYEAQARNPVSTAYSAPLAASNGTCLGSASGGLQSVGIGLSFGTTTLDEGCDARYDAIVLNQLGEADAARARLCLKPEIAKAFEKSGKACK